MADNEIDTSGTNMEQIKIVMNSLYLCLQYALTHVANTDGASAASELKEEMLTALRHGQIDMAVLEDSKTFDFVISKIEDLALPKS